jgi:hypothetical protein
LASQDTNHFDIDQIGTLVSEVFVGRTTDPRAAGDALKLCGLAASPAYIKALGRLTQQPSRINPDDPDPYRTPHEFVVSTKDLGQVEKITVWGSQHPQVMAALDTTPGRTFTEEDADENT